MIIFNENISQVQRKEGLCFDTLQKKGANKGSYPFIIFKLSMYGYY